MCYWPGLRVSASDPQEEWNKDQSSSPPGSMKQREAKVSAYSREILCQKEQLHMSTLEFSANGSTD